MSATGRGRERDSHDFHPTPMRCAIGCVRLLEIREGQRVIEPSAGTGNFLRAIHQVHGVLADAVEMDPDRYGALLKEAPKAELFRGRWERFGWRFGTIGYDWVVGNPPYTFAEAHVRHGLFAVRDGGCVAMLLRVGIRHTKGRRSFNRDLPLWRRYNLDTRPKFDGKGTDAAEYALFVWKRGYTGRVIEDSLDWEHNPDPDVARIRLADWRQAA